MKPKKLYHQYTRKDGGKRKTLIASIFEDYWSEGFAEEGDPLAAKFDVNLLGQENLFDGYGPKDQIKLCRRLAEWFLRYAEWLEYKVSRQDKFNIRIQNY